MKNYLPNINIANTLKNGRSIHDGYQRGWGLQFGELKQKIKEDSLYLEAIEVARGRTIMQEENRMNLYLIIRFFLEKIGKLGHIIEFGSYKGGNAIFMAYIAKRILPGVKVYAMDTFEGMPETDKTIEMHSKGDFSGVDFNELCAYSASLGLDNLEFRRGLFQDTTPAVMDSGVKFNLVHIDCDIGDAVKYSYEISKPNMNPGGYWAFDDATTSSCLGATEIVEEILLKRDGKNSEQIYPHYVFRS